MSRKRLALPVLLGVLATCVTAAPAGAVVGGEPVDPQAVPWFVSLGGCGSTLVAPDRLLTAAHCVAGAASDTLGGLTVGNARRNVAHVALHPGWRQRNGRSYLDDVAIIQLDAPVADVRPVALGGSAPGEARILGRGRPVAPGASRSLAEIFDSTLRGAALRTMSDAACARAFRGYRPADGERFDRRMRCSIDVDGAPPLASGCNGDSGGPLWTGAADAPQQLGVVSWGGDRCGADRLPSVFADVARYRAFITDPAPTWAPARTGTGSTRISGAARAGRTLTCSLRGYVAEPGARLAYTWNDVGAGRGDYGRPKRVGRGKRYEVARANAGRRLACNVAAENAGGFLAVGAANVLVRR